MLFTAYFSPAPSKSLGSTFTGKRVLLALCMVPARILETCLYASDLKAAKGFYRDILGLELVAEQKGRHAFFRCGDSMLLLFNPKATRTESGTEEIEAPTHGAEGEGHAAFAVEPEEIENWRAHLEDHGIEIEREIHWPNGAHSLYFRDSAQNSLELATPSLWFGASAAG